MSEQSAYPEDYTACGNGWSRTPYITCYCIRPWGHRGRCRCECGSTTTKQCKATR